MRPLRPGVLLCLVAFPACRPDPDAVRASLLAADREFARAAQERRLDAWLEYAADSVLQVRPNARLTPGKGALTEAMGTAYADSSFTLNWEPVRAEGSAAGDLGYTVGLYQSRRRTPEGGTVAGTGKYVTIWRRDARGLWKVALDIGVSDGERP